ncbi:unnamed protein product [Rodentolepis nana]|uniref:WW domain-containing protein n=1 Tax=Rodentolepis nana TaxID=102285 RepID=A0A0R3TCA8_RODNA|nr:unnamed protein product [Rodentolepis nana]
MDCNDKSIKCYGEMSLQATDSKPQRCISSIESSGGSGEKVASISRPQISSHQSFNLPPKPTHSPPPVPTSPNSSSMLYPSIPDELSSFPNGAAPAKPPRLGKGSIDSYNAYDSDDSTNCEVFAPYGYLPSSTSPPQPLSRQSSQQSDGNVQMCSKGWFVEIDDEGNRCFTHPDTADQVSTRPLF